VKYDILKKKKGDAKLTPPFCSGERGILPKGSLRENLPAV